MQHAISGGWGYVMPRQKRTPSRVGILLRMKQFIDAALRRRCIPRQVADLIQPYWGTYRLIMPVCMIARRSVVGMSVDEHIMKSSSMVVRSKDCPPHGYRASHSLDRST